MSQSQAGYGTSGASPSRAQRGTSNPRDGSDPDPATRWTGARQTGSDSDWAGVHVTHARRTWTGAGPLRSGAGQ
jgi:hypothetical protein